MNNLYYKNYRRKGNMIFFLAIGGVFVAIGVLAVFFWELPWAIACLAAGALLAALPQFVIFSRYGMKGDGLRYCRLGIPRFIKTEAIGAAVICIYDEYRRWKGFVPATFQGKDGPVTVPALVLLRGADDEELDLCDTRTNVRLTFRREYITDMALDFDFLKELKSAGFGGKVYISEYIHALYKPAFEEIFGGGGYEVYDRIPKRVKRLQK